MRLTRPAYAGLAVATIGLGLVVHLNRNAVPSVLADIAGDALWAAMVFWWVSALVPAAGRPTRALGALGIATVVEVSQLLHTPWLDRIRSTFLGRLVLGSDFDWRDLAAYAAGVAAAVLAERIMMGGASRPSRGA